MTASVTHTPKSGPLLTGAEYESASHHTVNITASDVGAATTSHTHTHAATTGQTTDDHHAKSHVHLADGSGTVAHSSTSGQTANDHHNQSHAHSGADGSGTVAHSATTGQTTDDHHAQVHGAAQHTDITRSLLLVANIFKVDGTSTLVNLGASPNLTPAVAYPDSATSGAFALFGIASDWASGVITIQPVWSPGSTDAVAHTVRWSMTCKNVAAGTTITAAGTTVAFTGSSAARTVGVVVKDTATSTTLTPAAAGDLFTIELQRIGADAADTYVGVVNLLGILVTYTANQ